MDKTKIIEEYFQKEEGCSYKEFCDIYNNGDPLTGDLAFTKFPNNITSLLIESVVGKKYHAEFVSFLREQNFLTQYIYNFNRQAGWRHDHGYQNTTDPAKYLLRAFHWAMTSEGDSTWSQLEQLWQAKLRNNGIR